MNHLIYSTMRYSIYVLAISLLFFTACQDHQKENKETAGHTPDHAKIETNELPGDSTSNIVRSEAPDATTKTEQGYALPRFDDGMAQSPINILSSSAENDP